MSGGRASDAAGRARLRRWRDAALWTAGLGLAAALMRLVARRVSGDG